MTIQVLIVEDSLVMQQVLTALIEEQGDIKVIGAARDPFEARELIKSLKPDIITLDVEMPLMDGITFLEKLMRLRPMPVIMVSSLTESNAKITLRALELGAVDFATKPKGDGKGELSYFGAMLREKLRGAAHVEPRPARTLPKPSPAAQAAFKSSGIIAIGASTGGTEAIKEVLARLPPNVPPIVIVQHMPEMFTQQFARRLNDLCSLKVTEAVNGERLESGHVYIAPGNWHLRIVKMGQHFEAHVDQTERVNLHRPSVDVLFRSVSKNAGARAIGVLLTGMGKDGAIGLGEMKQTGAFTIAQDQNSCVVFGMPKAAIESGCVDCVAPIDTIASRIVDALRQDRSMHEKH
ncbi:MAG: chemotaxis response regulator protein-glutamate methylesterase [Pseudomonadota bacterium]